MLIPRFSSRHPLPLGRAQGRHAFAFLALLLLTIASNTQAQSSPSEVTSRAPEDSSRFSVGAGVGYTFYSDNALGGLSYGRGGSVFYGLGARSPYAIGLVEVRLTPRVRLGIGIVGSYSRVGERRGVGPGSLDAPAESWGAGSASVSARYVLNPGAVVEVSPLLAVGAHAGRAKGQPYGSVMNSQGGYDQITQESRDTGLDARLGLVLEYRLLPQLWLRMESSFLSASYSQVHSTYRAPGQTTKDHYALANITAGFSPALQLRMTF